MIKRILVFTFLACSLLLSRNTSAQCLERGNSIIDLSARIGDYNDIYHVHSVSGAWSGRSGSAIYSLGYELVVFKWLGVGAQLRYDKYIDSATQKQTTFSFNVPVLFNIHIVHTTHVDLYAGMAFGLSTVNYSSNDITASKYNGIGSLYDIHAGFRIFLGDHFGISIPISYTSFSYPSLNYSSPSTSINNWADLTLGGLNIGLGLNYKF
jgi:hypothetical protein